MSHRSSTWIKGASAVVVRAGLGVAVLALGLGPASASAARPAPKHPSLVVQEWGSNDGPLKVVEAPPRRTDIFPRLILANTSGGPLPAVFAIRVEKGRLSWTALGELSAKQTRTVRDMHGSGAKESFGVERILDEWVDPKEGVSGVKKAVAESLVKAGLDRKEAEALMDDAEKSCFGADGLRFLYLRPALDKAQVEQPRN